MFGLFSGNIGGPATLDSADVTSGGGPLGDVIWVASGYLVGHTIAIGAERVSAGTFNTYYTGINPILGTFEIDVSTFTDFQPGDTIAVYDILVSLVPSGIGSPILLEPPH